MRFRGKILPGLAFTLSLSLFAANASTPRQSISAPPAQSETRQSKRRSVEDFALSREKKIQQAMDLIEGVLANAHRINPVGYKILAEVESATLLWRSDNERAFSILKDAIGAIRRLLEEKNETTVRDYPAKSKERELWFLSIRKIAALKPELVQELLTQESSAGKSGAATGMKWTDEAHALMSVAEDRMGTDPKAAGRIAERSIPLGLADWASFLNRLNERDPVEAQRLARVYIDRLRDSSINPAELWNFQRFALMPDLPASLRDYYFQALVIRLRRELRPDLSSRELEAALSTAQTMARIAAQHSPQWQQEFDGLALAFEAVFKERSLPLPGPPVRRVIDMSAVSPATPGNTQEIKDSLAKVGTIRDLYSRDIEYQKLAIRAAANADTGLAEEIASKINDQSFRRFVSAQIYSPLIKKAISESDWTLSQNLALNIAEPLARALAFESIAQAMLSAKAEKQAVIDLYNSALARLYDEFTTERVVKAVLLLARALYRLDHERGFEAIKSFAYVLNKLTLKGGPVEETPLESSLSIWVRHTNYALTADELMNLPDMVAGAFQELARRDVDAALGVSMRLRDQGVYSFAQLAIARVLLEQANKAGPTPRKRAGDK